MVQDHEQVERVRALLEGVARELGLERPPALGAMMENAAAVEHAAAIAARCDFLSIGTNDLTAAILGADRFAAGAARTHDPRVLRAIARIVWAAHDAGLTVEVCGEAASDPLVLPLLLGLGVDAVSVGAARVGLVRRWVRGCRAGEADRLARIALSLDGAVEVEAAIGPLARELQAGELACGAA
jgi:phosphoenolpyruvate-protein kinase (PTS system EI component)